jgi:hypothetical protein
MPTNEAPRPRRGRLLPRGALVWGIAVFVVSAACTALVDRSTTQCHTDGDCARFGGGRPLCQGGVCVKSDFQPDNCFFGSPQQSSDFLNQCSTEPCTPFDNCGLLGLCDGGGADVALIKPPPPDAGTAASDGGAAEAGPLLPSCVDPSAGRANVVYLTGSSNFPPLLSKLAPLVVAAGYTPVYLVTNSCRGVSSVMSPTASAHTISDPAPTSTAKPAQYFGADGNPVSCSLGGSVTVDVGESDIFASSCSGFADQAPDVNEYLGPVQAMVFVVPAASDQKSISAEAAREVFGMGGSDAGKIPWTDPSLFFIRNQNTGTQQMIGRAIGVPADQFWGVDRSSAQAIDLGLRGISDGTQAEKAIGFISTDYYDNDRMNLRALAFQAFGQECAYLPDTPNRTDKQNVRDGHYPIWGPVHFFAAAQDGVPLSAGAVAFTNTVLVPAVQQSLLDAFISASLVPSCAMRVTRSSELGALSSYAPPFQCGCYFDASVNGIVAPASPPGCTRCATNNDCTDPTRPTCNLGFCEAKP